jgi:hypothetical protein
MAYKTVVTNPSPLVRQTIEFLRQMTKQKGEFALAMLLPSETGLSDKWNLVLSAPWIDDDGLGATIPTITALLLEHLSKVNAHRLERVSVLRTSDPLVVFALEELLTPLGEVSFVQHFWGRPDPVRAGVPQLEDAYVLVANRPGTSRGHQVHRVQTRA